jgi:hypothetical protein
MAFRLFPRPAHEKCTAKTSANCSQTTRSRRPWASRSEGSRTGLIDDEEYIGSEDCNFEAEARHPTDPKQPRDRVAIEVAFIEPAKTSISVTRKDWETSRDSKNHLSGPQSTPERSVPLDPDLS